MNVTGVERHVSLVYNLVVVNYNARSDAPPQKQPDRFHKTDGARTPPQVQYPVIRRGMDENN